MSHFKQAKNALLCMQRHSWEQGVAMQAMLETGDLPAVILMAHEAVNRQTADGRAATIGVSDGVTDPCSVGEGLLAAARVTGSASLRAGCERLLRWAEQDAPRAEDGTLYHLTGSRQMWVDSLYMLPPYLAAAGRYREALRQAQGLYQRLYDPASGLMAHRWDEEARRLVTPVHWGVGNGWALAGLTRLQAMLPDDFSADRQRLQEMIRRLLKALRPHMRPDGLFHNVVDDPSTFVETNLSQMAAYTVYRGCIQGWLDASMASWADTMRLAAQGKVDSFGLVQGVCGAPDFDHPGTAPEGQAFYLLMEQAHQDWQQRKGASSNEKLSLV